MTQTPPTTATTATTRAGLAAAQAGRRGRAGQPGTGNPYRRRREAGAASREQTRLRLLAAADALFLQQGYAATTVGAIAARARVSVQTLYLAWGSKRALLRAAADAAVTASDLPAGPEQWRVSVRAEIDQAAGQQATARDVLAALTAVFVRVAERAAPYWRLQQHAAASDPEAAADWHTATTARRQTLAALAQAIPATGLRPGLSPEDVTDTLWALASPATYDLLTVTGSHTPPDYQAWLQRTLTAALCPAP